MSDILTVQETSLTAIADEIRKKTGKKDKIKFPTGFVSEIDSIQTGGGSAPAEEIKEKDVNFFDYDGTLIASYTEAEAKTLTTLPTPPEHSGLVFQGWNYTLEEVKANAEMADIGALYTTDDGATRLEIEVLERRDIRVRFSQTKASGVLIDWGDGKSERSSGIAGQTYALHNYEEQGKYTITLAIDDDCNVTLGSYSSYLICIDSLSSNAAQNALQKLYIGDRVVKIDKSAFSNHHALHRVSMNQGITAINEACFKYSSIDFITIPPGIDSIPYGAFNSCSCLKNISLPVNVRNLDQYSIYQCNALKRLNLKNVTNPQSRAISGNKAINKIVVNADIAYIPNYFCSDCAGLEMVTFLGKVKIFYSGALSSCYSLKSVDLTHCESVPTLQDGTVFSNASSDLEILVPAALADEWRQATNWTALASKIKGV
jgi:hypothetical protein